MGVVLLGVFGTQVPLSKVSASAQVVVRAVVVGGAGVLGVVVGGLGTQEPLSRFSVSAQDFVVADVAGVVFGVVLGVVVAGVVAGVVATQTSPDLELPELQAEPEVVVTTEDVIDDSVVVVLELVELEVPGWQSKLML